MASRIYLGENPFRALARVDWKLKFVTAMKVLRALGAPDDDAITSGSPLSLSQVEVGETLYAVAIVRAVGGSSRERAFIQKLQRSAVNFVRAQRLSNQWRKFLGGNLFDHAPRETAFALLPRSRRDSLVPSMAEVTRSAAVVISRMKSPRISDTTNFENIQAVVWAFYPSRMRGLLPLEKRLLNSVLREPLPGEHKVEIRDFVQSVRMRHDFLPLAVHYLEGVLASGLRPVTDIYVEAALGESQKFFEELGFRAICYFRDPKDRTRLAVIMHLSSENFRELGARLKARQSYRKIAKQAAGWKNIKEVSSLDLYRIRALSDPKLMTPERPA